ncbi:MAG: tetratricopeptide repeat protein, partial [Limisphaerales bacterium]
SICAGLVLVTLAAYWPLQQCGFINYDDPLYVTANETVKNGLTWSGVKWAFTSGHASNWHPLTWISHMLDVQLFGLHPVGHHLTNLLFHLANTLLVFLLLQRLTAATWRSAFVAALFALHPTHVESVAWISERKDVLSTFFGLLSTWFYISYCRIRQDRGALPKQGRGEVFASRAYLMAFSLFACSLLSKPMLVTLPFVWLLLDWWPLRRFSADQATSFPAAFSRLFVEKIPFLVLTIASSVITYLVQQRAIMAELQDNHSRLFQFAIIVEGYIRYIGKLLYPVDLAVIYPIPRNYELALVFAWLLVLVALSTIAFLWLRTRPWFSVGWFWFVGTLVPVIGFVKVGLHSIADRYTYVPSIGLFVLLTWGVCEWYKKHQKWRAKLFATVAVALLFASWLLTYKQVGHWKSTRTLFEHALSVTKQNGVAHDILGLVYIEEKNWEKAREHFAKAIEYSPMAAFGYSHMGGVLLNDHQYQAAARYYEKATLLEGDRGAHFQGLGEALLKMGELERSLTASLRAIALDPKDAVATYNAGTVYLLKGQTEQAIQHLSAAIQLRPDFPQAHNNLAYALQQLGRTKEAEVHYAKAVAAGTDYPGASDSHFGYAKLLFEQGRYSEAEHFFLLTLQLTPKNVDAFHYLGVITQKDGRTIPAISCWRKVLELDPNRLEALNNLAWLLATARDPHLRNATEATLLASRVVAQRRNAATLDTLAAALAADGFYDKAIVVAENALELAGKSSRPDLQTAISSRLSLYRENKPYLE